ncbi:membrane protein [Staphylococcus virus vB_SurM-PSU6]|nr:membrane protein [Staphylococcus virus vB_SurM-PSU6]
MNNNIAIFIFKTLVIIIFLLLILSVINSLSLIYSIRPSVVMTYFTFGGIVSYVALTIIDKFLLKKEDPLPEYVLKQVEINDKEIKIIKKIIESNYGITAEEIKVRAKAQRRVEEDSKKEDYDENEERN